MPEVLPFRGVRYADGDALSELVCPPYDVISPTQQEDLHQRHPHNAVRLELAKAGGATGYAAARSAFDDWLQDGVLQRDSEPSFYLYRQDFVTPDGDRKRVAGVIGALTLEPLGSAGVLPHERTMPGPKKDRLALLQALPVNVSPIYAIYRGAGGLRSLIDSFAERPPEGALVEAGIRHRLWRTEAGAELSAIRERLASGPLVIADGHHRYETAWEFAAADPSDEARGSIMSFLVDVDTEEVVVLPYHRLVTFAGGWPALKRALEADFPCSPTDRDKLASGVQASSADHALGFVGPDEALLVELGDADVVEHLGDRAPAWRALDVVALHEVIFPTISSGGPEDIAFTRSDEEVLEQVAAGRWSAGVLMRPVAPAEVVDVASSGERMPQKASYFWPKALTGLVFHELR
ncbi:MAG TPA: DUF1015 domain-containing protein [Actinomycetota bacterium]|nr:DUF1015 domain-containing protein [Actinomycetota bacterium]